MSSAYQHIGELRVALRNGDTTARNQVEHYLNCIKQNQHLNAFLEVFETEALQKADETDARIAAGKGVGKLAGVVIGVKDVLCYKGHKVSAASRMLENFESLFSATAVQRLLDEDAIIIGRLNCDEFAMGSTNEHSAYGKVRNALDTSKVPGGSSGGSAVAVQAGLCHVALGTDTGGSVRQPASFCGVVGFKSTYGRVSRHGLIAYASSFDQIGVLSHSVYDAALLTQIMAGGDRFDATCSAIATEKYGEKLNFEGAAKVAYFAESLQHPGLDPDVANQMEKLFGRLQKTGHKVEEAHFPYMDYVVPTYYILTTAEASSNLARYDGIHYGYRHPDADDMEDTYKKTRTLGFGKEVKRRIMLGTFVLSAGYYDAYYTKAQKMRRLISEHTNALLEKHDFIATPVCPGTAFELDSTAMQDPVSMYLGDIYTVQANLAGLPAISLPLFVHQSNGMPFGLQLVAKRFEERKLLAFSECLMHMFTADN